MIDLFSTVVTFNDLVKDRLSCNKLRWDELNRCLLWIEPSYYDYRAYFKVSK